MILDFFDGKLNGDSWEELCQSCYRIRYREQHYTEIPAAYRGDAGIEGFTLDGVVNQCYYPEKEYSDDDLYNHQRDKMTTDISKLLSPVYKNRLKDLGVPVVKEWHFVTPYYKDSRIIQHAETKRSEVIAKRIADPKQFDYIDEDFRIFVIAAEELRFEITRIIRNSCTDIKLNLAIRNVKQPDWTGCESEKVDNIKRKVAAVMGNEEDELYNDIVDTYIEAYIKGLEIMRILRLSYAEIYEDVYKLEQAYKKQVKIKTGMNTNQSMNSVIFNEILDDFERQLKEACGYFTVDSIIELKVDIISMWLADCSMKFRK